MGTHIPKKDPSATNDQLKDILVGRLWQMNFFFFGALPQSPFLKKMISLFYFLDSRNLSLLQIFPVFLKNFPNKIKNESDQTNSKIFEKLFPLFEFFIPF